MTNPLRSAANISVVTLGSRILGFIRDVMMFRMLDMWAVGPFALAWMIPNMLRRLFGEGALSASFIPAYAKARESGGSTAARALLASITGWLLLVTSVCCAVVVVSSFVIPPGWIGQESDSVDAATQGELLLDLLAILFPYSIPICLAAILTGALNTHGTFALPAAAPIVLNLFWIGGLVFAMATGMTDPARIVRVLSVLLLVGGLAQLCLSLVPMWRRGLLPRPRVPPRDDPARAVIRAMGPTLVGMSLLQLNSVLDQALAYYLIDPSGPAFIYQANRLLLFPHALTNLALATAIFPRLAEAGARGDLAAVRRDTDRAVGHTLMVALPAAVGMILVAEPLISVMFSGSKMQPEDLRIATHTTVCLVASLPMIGVAQLHARAFYAVGDFATPAWMALWLLLLNLALDVVLVVGLGLGVAGFAIATTLASVANAWALRRRLRRRCPEPVAATGRLWHTLAACAVMGVVVSALLWSSDAEGRWDRMVFDLILPVAAGVLSYTAVQFLFGHRRFRMR